MKSTKKVMGMQTPAIKLNERVLSSYFKQWKKITKCLLIAETTNKMVPPSNKGSKDLQNEQEKWF